MPEAFPIPKSVLEPYRDAVDSWQQARRVRFNAREVLLHLKRDFRNRLVEEGILRQQEYEHSASEKLVEDRKAVVRNAIRDLWQFIPVLEKNDSSISHHVLFRGTILRRLILDPTHLDLLPEGRAQLLDIEGMGSIDSDMPAITEWTERFDMALHYAKDGYACDPVQGSRRNDPVVLALTSEQLNACRRKDNVYAASDKTTITPKSLYGGNVTIFRLPKES